jgi:hypothetical protein
VICETGVLAMHGFQGRSSTRFVTVALGALLVVGPASAASRFAEAGTSVPSSLCTLKVKKQLPALGVANVCKAGKTARVGALTIYGANWGSTDLAVAVQVYTGTSESHFKASFGNTGTAVKIGSFGREGAGTGGTSLSAWVDGVGLLVVLHRPPATTLSEYRAYLGPVLVFAKALAAQL